MGCCKLTYSLPLFFLVCTGPFLTTSKQIIFVTRLISTNTFHQTTWEVHHLWRDWLHGPQAQEDNTSDGQNVLLSLSWNSNSFYEDSLAPSIRSGSRYAKCIHFFPILGFIGKSYFININLESAESNRPSQILKFPPLPFTTDDFRTSTQEEWMEGHTSLNSPRWSSQISKSASSDSPTSLAPEMGFIEDVFFHRLGFEGMAGGWFKCIIYIV